MDFGKLSGLELAHYIQALLSIPLSQLKIQKLAYYVQAWHLAYFEQPLIDEDFQAWVHGPVLRSIWDGMKGLSMLRQPVELKPIDREDVRRQIEAKLNQDQLELIASVMEEYGDKSDFHLEALTHSEDPWKDARRGYSIDEPCSDIISKASIQQYYQSLLVK